MLRSLWLVGLLCAIAACGVPANDVPWLLGEWAATENYRYDPSPPGPQALASQTMLDDEMRAELARMQQGRLVRVKVELVRTFHPDGRVEERVARATRQSGRDEEPTALPRDEQVLIGSWRADDTDVVVTWSEIPNWMESRHDHRSKGLGIDVLPSPPWEERYARRGTALVLDRSTETEGAQSDWERASSD